jgi:hypothetical protein
MQRHTTSHVENKNRRGSPVGIRWLGGRSLHTNRSIAQIFLGVASFVTISSFPTAGVLEEDILMLSRPGIHHL